MSFVVFIEIRRPSSLSGFIDAFDANSANSAFHERPPVSALILLTMVRGAKKNGTWEKPFAMISSLHPYSPIRFLRSSARIEILEGSRKVRDGRGGEEENRWRGEEKEAER